MIKSMTGFGRGEAREDGIEFMVEIKTVNHRYTDVFVKMPRQIGFLEEKVRNLVSKAVSRGKIDVFITYSNTSEDSKSVVYDEGLAKAYIASVQKMKERFGLKDDVTLTLVSRFPDVFRIEQADQDEDKLWQLLKAAVDNALQSLISMRQHEGEGLSTDMLEKASFIESLLKDISVRAPEVVKEYKAKLENRIKDLLEQPNLDESRLATEVAIFADRCSIDEEIVRLASHIGQLRDTLKIQQPVGRKLDFLIQEMNREINTIGSKANDLTITRNVVDIKSEIEKLREQVQNIE
ncbi:MAG: YicC family protein [Clostridiales bacterium]|nr:YicC family protein [Clostridiales bacterium]